MKISHILFTTDLSPESLHPLLTIATLAKDNSAKLTLLHVIYELHVAPHGAPMAPPIAPLDISNEVSHAKTILSDQQALIDDKAEVETAVVTGDNVHKAVNEYAKKHEVDLIAIATHGRSGFRNFALGSTAEAVLRHSLIPVLCFPQADT